MLNFNEEKFLMEENGALSLRRDIEIIVDGICRRGYKNLFLMGIGGTIAFADQMASILKSRSTIDVYVENAAEFTTLGNRHFSKDSVVIVDSVSGDTQEILEALKLAKAVGATVIGFIEKEDSPLAKLTDHLISYEGGVLYKFYATILRFMYNAGEFTEYDRFFEELKNMPLALLEVKRDAEPDAERFADAYKDEAMQYLVGSGNLWGATYSYAMCVMEEMQWMRTKSIHAAEFFHGTLEVVDRNTSVILFKGEDDTRPLMDRVEKFVNRISGKVTVFDTKSYPLNGISECFRGLASPFVMRAITERISKHLEEKRKHPLEIRRYYRQLNY